MMNKVCLHKHDDYVDISTFSIAHILLLCLECGGHRIERLVGGHW